MSSSSYAIHQDFDLEALLNPNLTPEFFPLAAPTVGSATAEEFLYTVPELNSDADGCNLYHTVQLTPATARLDPPENEAKQPVWEQGVPLGGLEEGPQDIHAVEYAVDATTDTEGALLECLGCSYGRGMEPLPGIEQFKDVELFFDIKKYERSTQGALPDVSEGVPVLSESGSSPFTADDSSCCAGFTCTNDGSGESPRNATSDSDDEDDDIVIIDVRPAATSFTHVEPDDDIIIIDVRPAATSLTHVEPDDDVVIIDVRPVGTSFTHVEPDSGTIVIDRTRSDFQPKARRATRTRRPKASRAGPYSRLAPRLVKRSTRQKLVAWDIFVAKWHEVEESLAVTPELHDELRRVGGYVRQLVQDTDFSYWTEPLLGSWKQLKSRVKSGDEQFEQAESLLKALVDKFVPEK
ncbi:hypothetical protein SLS56_010541 [Neofusicoccum ribis]|uniref:Uncharacterized protein n=1 Tax=Neofusicoccum ribis TaxID=45134 RepID=A0ABR3SE47_9PEZI